MKRTTLPHARRLRRKCRGKAKHRLAAALMEFALTIPVAVVLVFGTIEISNGIFLRQAVSEAAYEGARAAVRSSGTQSQAQARIREVLANREISGESITLTPTPDKATRGTKLTVTVSVPVSSLHSVIPLHFLRNKTITKSVTMVRM